MRVPRVARSFFALLTVVLLAAPLLTGCGDNDSITGAPADPTSDFVIEDPLDGVLNATMGVTPVEPGPRIDRLADALGLTDEQKAALAEAYAVFRAGIEALKDQVKDGSLTRDEAHAAADLLRADFEAALQVILTAEQYEQLQEMRQNRDCQSRGHRDPEARWTAWLTEIGADEAQVDAVFAALATLHDGLRDLRDQVKAGDLTRDEAREAAEALREAFDAALQEILTEEQYAALQELRPDQPPRRQDPPGPPGRRGGR